MVWYDTVCCGMVRCGVVRYGTVRYVAVWHGKGRKGNGFFFFSGHRSIYTPFLTIPFHSILIQSTPFRSVPFRSTPFPSIPGGASVGPASRPDGDDVSGRDRFHHCLLRRRHALLHEGAQTRALGTSTQRFPVP